MNRKNTLHLMIPLAILILAGILFYFLQDGDREQYTSLVDSDQLEERMDALGQYIGRTDLTEEEISRDVIALLKAGDIPYTIDDCGNIIVRKDAAEGYEDLPPVVFAAELDPLEAQRGISSLAASEALALREPSGRSFTVLFLANDRNLHQGAREISSRFFPVNSDVILLSSGDWYLSKDSYAAARSRITRPYQKSDRACDTMIRLGIKGMTPGKPEDLPEARPDPFDEISRVLTQFKSKAYDYEIADLSIQGEGNLSPASLEAVILVNAFSLEKITRFLDKRVSDLNGKFGGDAEGFEFYYEIMDEDAELPETVMDPDAAASLTNLLYTMKKGSYTFSKGEAPEGYDDESVYAVNIPESLELKDGKIEVSLYSSALNSFYLDKVLQDDDAAALLSGASFSTYEIASEFKNGGSRLGETLSTLYQQVNDVTALASVLPEDYDTGFTACSYLASKSGDLDTLHLSLDTDSTSFMLNTLLYLLQEDGSENGLSAAD